MDRIFRRTFTIYLLIVGVTFILYHPPFPKITFFGLKRGKEFYGEDKRCFVAAYKSSSERETYLVLPRVDANVLEVSVNGDILFLVGDKRSASKLWTQTFAIPVKFNEGDNEIKLCVSSAGVARIYIEPFISDHPWIYVWTSKFMFLWSSYFSFIFAVVVGVLFLIISFMVVEEKILFALMGLYSIFSGLFISFHTFYINAFPFSFHLALNKFLIASSVPTAVFYYIIMRYISGMKRSKVLRDIALITITTVLILFFFLREEVLVKSMTYSVPLLLLLPFLLTFPLLDLIKGNNKFFVSPVVLTIVSMIHYYITVIFKFYNHVFLVYALSYNMGMFVRYYMMKLNYYMLGAKYDDLTGALKRAAFKELKLPEKTIVAFLDLNNFKKYNDENGHRKGDEALMKLVEVTKENVKGEDKIIRYGGDEFVVVLKNCEPKNAEKIIRNIESLFEKFYPYGFSYGIEEIKGDLDRALSMADYRMYKMKREGEK